MQKIKLVSIFLIVLNLITTVGYCEEISNNLSMQELALPSEVKDLAKQSGSIYYNTAIKNKVLIPTHIWGEVFKPGMHFIPTDTTLIKGLSMAGGPNGMAKLDEVIVTRVLTNGVIKKYEFDLTSGGKENIHQFKLEAGDSIFVTKDQFLENRTYYTSLIGVVLSIITTAIVIKNN